MPFSPDLAPLRPVSPMPTPAAPATLLSSSAVRFLMVGGIATAVDVGLFNVLHFGAGTGPLSSKVVSTLVAGVVAFVGNREFSFGDQKGGSVRRQVIAFALVSAAALALNLLVIAGAGALGLKSAVELNAAANVVGLALATAFRFYGCRRWVFPASQDRVIDLSHLPEAERLAA